MKISKIVIQNFRGISIPLTLDLTKNGKPTSAILYGRNGTGKSSITDAWEWSLTHQILNLTKEGISAKDYPHKASHGKNAGVKIEFIDPIPKITSINFNNSRISSPDVTGNYEDLRQAAIYPNYLRYSELQKFVLFSKTEKYKYIAKFFGLDPFLKCQADLQSTITRLSTSRDALREVYKQAASEISQAIGSNEHSEGNILTFFNSISLKQNLSPVKIVSDIVSAKKEFDEVIKANLVAAKISAIEALREKISKLIPFPKLSEKVNLLEKAFVDLKISQKNLTNFLLSELYSVALRVLPNSKDTNLCPICDKPFDGNLLEHLNKKHEEYSKFNSSLRHFEICRDSLLGSLEAIRRVLPHILENRSHKTEEVFGDQFDELHRVQLGIEPLLKALNTSPKDITELACATNPTIQQISDIEKKIAEWIKALEKNLSSLKESPGMKSLAEDYTKFVKVSSAFYNIRQSKAKGSLFSKKISNLEVILKLLSNHINSQISTTFSRIEADVLAFFNVLEGANPVLANPKIILVPGKNKAIELQIEFASDVVTPAYKFMSESQINSFGLAIFLASVKHFNQNLKFFILDDVVNSFDAYKRPKLSQLIAKFFSDFQVLILTHDQIFFDTVQRDFPQWQRFKFSSWDYNTGPRFCLAKNYSEEIQSFLDDDKPVIAGQSLGRYLEWTFGLISECLQTPIRYKTENIYTLSELYEPMVKRIGDKLKEKGKRHKLIELFNDFDQGTIFRNYCAHWKNEATPFTTSEIQGVFSKWQEIENSIYCPNCKVFATYSKQGGATYIRCTCGSLDLKAQEYYTDLTDK